MASHFQKMLIRTISSRSHHRVIIVAWEIGLLHRIIKCVLPAHGPGRKLKSVERGNKHAVRIVRVHLYHRLRQEVHHTMHRLYATRVRPNIGMRSLEKLPAILNVEGANQLLIPP